MVVSRLHVLEILLPLNRKLAQNTVVFSYLLTYSYLIKIGGG